MAIIYSYPSVTPVVADILLITQASDPSKATKSITLSSIKTLFNLDDSLNGVGTPGHIPFFETSSRLVDSFISQDANGLVFIGSQASGTRFTNTSVSTTDLTALGNTTLGEDDSTQVTIESTLSLQGPVKDNAGNLGAIGQILVNSGSGSVSWGNPNEGTVKSVGITETGNALTITGSPVTSEGDINIAGAGTASQVILGDLTLTDLPVGTVKGTGTVNFVPKWSAADTLQDSIIFDDGTNVGIGTPSPQDKFEVQGSIYATPITYTSNQDAYALRMGASNNLAFDMGIKIKSDSSGVPYMSLRSHNTEDLLTLESDNVGIGTAGINPEDKLHVMGTVRSVIDTGSGFGFLTNRGTENSASGIRWDNNNSSLILKDSSEVTTTQIRSSGFSYINGGRLGINTPSPASTLDVKETTTDIAGQIIVGGSIDTDDRAFGKLCFANTISANSQPNKILASIEGRKNGSSNRGILTFDVSDGSGSLKERMRIDSYGFVGVGKNNPQRELDVVGTVRIAGALEFLQSSNNTFVGTSTGNISTTTGSSNVAVGFESLNNNTGGNGNVAVGKGALSANTGNNNTGTGSLALENISTGAQNTGIGRQALQNATTGLCNVGIGHIAGALVDGGAVNTAPDVSIFIGGSTKSKTNNDTNQIVIGHNAIGEGSNTARIGNTSVSELHVGGNNAGVVLKSPNGTAYIIKVTNAGALTVTAV